MRDWTLLRLVAFAVVAALVITLIYKSPTFLAPAKEDKPLVIAILKTIDYNTFWGAVRDGCLSAAADYRINLSVRGPFSEKDIDEQIRIMEKAINEKPAVILLAAGDFYRLVPEVQKAMSRGIPVATIDSFINSDDAVSKIGTDNLEVGRKCALALLKWVKPGGKVAVFSYIRGSSTAIDRETGLRIESERNFQLLPTLYSNSDIGMAYDQARKVLADNSDLDSMVALSEPTTVGVARALQESGRAGRIALIGVDNAFTVLKQIESGVVKATVVQQPFNMGYLGVATARKIIDKQKVESRIDTGSVTIEKDNLFLQPNQKLLFPFDEALR